MKRLVVLLAVAALGVPAFAQVPQNLIDRLDRAQDTLNEIMAVPDKAIPNSILEQATCVGVVPGLLKGAFIFGAEHGQGVVTCRTPRGWSGPVFLQMTGGSWGLQIGGQATDLVLVAVNQKGFQDLLQSKFKIGAGASAAAGPVGRDAGASTNWKMQSELLTWSRSRGVFAGIDLNGVAVTQNRGDTQLLYGAPHGFQQILGGYVPVPPTARPFVRTVAKYFHEASE
ncbi:MAG TPA: lipid-binding SYLF domain-containing protein [Acidobacteriaceae bacterium]|nr:lipid-binding SYLF domain-containing protein [Acidobacteriaceae bacterium]